jgi:hypothetical protein
MTESAEKVWTVGCTRCGWQGGHGPDRDALRAAFEAHLCVLIDGPWAARIDGRDDADAR